MFGSGFNQINPVSEINIINKAIDLLNQSKLNEFPLFSCSKNELPSQNPKFYFNSKRPNCLIIYNKDGSKRRVYNNPTISYQKAYLTDSTGTIYNNWADYFSKYPVNIYLILRKIFNKSHFSKFNLSSFIF